MVTESYPAKFEAKFEAISTTNRPLAELRDDLYRKGEFGRSLFGALLMFLFNRRNVVMRVPDSETLDKILYEVFQGERRGVEFNAILNGYIGGIYCIYNREAGAEGEKPRWEISGNT